jgi:DNA polymerase I
MHKLFILDAMALIYRAHFAFSQNPRINSKGMNTGATFGFTNTLLEIIQKEKPTHLAVAFDTQAPTFRHEQFEAYKAQRQEQPEDITVNIPFIKQMIRAFQIPILALDGYEADDVVGTVAKKLGSPEFKIYMMTSDKDYCQLVTDHVFVYKPAFMGKGPEVYDTQKVLEKFNIVNVDQVRDILGLQGDSVDNIPGIPGIGEKTAQKLIAEYGSVENLIANADKLTGKMKENVIKFADQGLQSKHLATIHCEVPIEFDADSLIYKGIDKELMSPLLDELEFRNLKTKLLGSETTQTATKEISTGSKETKGKKKAVDTNQTDLFGSNNTIAAVTLFENKETEAVSTPNLTIEDAKHDYHIIDTPQLRQELISFLAIQKEFCFDTETTGTDALTSALVGLSFCYFPTEAFYVPVPANEVEVKAILEEFRSVFEDENISKIGHNIKYDIQMLANYSIEVKGKLFDTMLAHYLIEPDQRHGMDALSAAYLNYQPISITTLIGKKGAEQGNMREVELTKVAEYAAEDADVTFQLKQKFTPIIKERKLEIIFDQIESPLIEVLADMERSGVKIDMAALEEFSKLLEKDIIEAEEKVFAMAGERFNLSSPKQLGVILFEKLKLVDKPKKTETGQYATGEEVLTKLAEEHEIVNDILTFREYQKLKNTYVDALPQMINVNTGFVHTSYNQAIAATGRLSSQNPNLQNIPIRTEKGREIRKAFIPRNPDSVILSADYSQIELRIMAHFSKDKSMISAFMNGLDIHTATASKVFKVAESEVNGDMRRKAKMVNFGIIYGISAFGLAQRLAIPRREAAEIIEAYWQEFPNVKTYMDEVIHDAREQTFVSTLKGRRRYLRDINSRNQTVRGYAERNAINAPIQGTAADIIKKAMIDIHAWMKQEKLRSKMILQVHDELVFDAYQDELDILKPQIELLMQNAEKLLVPLEVGMGVGVNWLEAH